MNHFQSGRLYNTLNDIDGLHGGMFRSTGTMTPWVFRGSTGNGAAKQEYSQYILQNTRGRSPRRRIQILLPQSTPSAWDSTLITKYNYEDNYVRLKRIQSLRAEIIDSGRGIYISDGELQRFIQGVSEQEVMPVSDALLLSRLLIRLLSGFTSNHCGRPFTAFPTMSTSTVRATRG